MNTTQTSLPNVDSAAPEWILTTVEEDNEELRNDFFYDHVSRAYAMRV